MDPLLSKLIKTGYIKVNRHPTADLSIYNYTGKAQFNSVWNDWTLKCRGLIMDGQYQTIARPFGKFFNIEEQKQEVPNESFEVYDKLDGSLGILYWINDNAFIATRGSFVSEQAVRGTEILNVQYKTALAQLDRSKTYLFEIIYPENRIVVDYGGKTSLILLAIIDTATGNEEELVDIGFPLVKRYDRIDSIYDLKALEEPNREGFVIRFRSGFRLKVKFDEYKRLHKIITNTSRINIWEVLKKGESFDDLLDKVPDEFYDWVQRTATNLQSEFKAVENTARKELRIMSTPRETAEYTLTCKYPKVIFNMINGKDYKPAIWKEIKPTIDE